MEITRVKTEDIDQLVQISWQTFFDSFNHLNTPANMSAYMDKAFTHEKLLSEIQNKNSQFYFVKDGNQTIGYLKVNQKDAQTEFKDDISMEIERIYILDGHQSNGYGTLLLDKVKEIAVSSGIKYVWLGVWEKNPAAIRFYERNGFDVFSSHEFQMGDEVQIDKLMICKLS
jgi:diamine N-acetyltransferase